MLRKYAELRLGHITYSILDLQSVIVELYSDLLSAERKKDKQYKETQELLKVIKSVQSLVLSLLLTPKVK